MTIIPLLNILVPFSPIVVVSIFASSVSNFGWQLIGISWQHWGHGWSGREGEDTGKDPKIHLGFLNPPNNILTLFCLRLKCSLVIYDFTQKEVTCRFKILLLVNSFISYLGYCNQYGPNLKSVVIYFSIGNYASLLSLIWSNVAWSPIRIFYDLKVQNEQKWFFAFSSVWLKLSFNCGSNFTG